MAEKAFLYDISLCTACRGCQVACKQWNEHPGEKTSNWGSYENPKELSPETWIKMRFIEMERDGKLDWRFLRQACLHCTEASCATVCPVKAISHTDEGFVHIDQEWCIGCGTCTQACPFNIPHLDHHAGTVTKCSGCTSEGRNRITAGEQPACIKSCPTNAITMGDREELVAEGHRRVDALKAAGYPNALLYGEKELGGLHVMYVLDDTPDAYGLPVNPQPATKDMVGKWVAGVATAGILASLPLLWIFRRREEMQAKSRAGGEK